MKHEWIIFDLAARANSTRISKWKRGQDFVIKVQVSPCYHDIACNKCGRQYQDDRKKEDCPGHVNYEAWEIGQE